MRASEPRRLQTGRFEIPIETEGRLKLPPGLIQSLGMEPGDLVALEPFEGLGKSVQIWFYRQILTFPLEALSPAIRWSFTVDFHRLPLTALEEDGALSIPPDTLPLRPGDRPVLRVIALSEISWPSVYVEELRSAEGSGRRNLNPP